MYCSAAVPKIFQDEPLEWRPSSFTLKSWTDTIAGYLYEAEKLSMCLWQNRRLMQDEYTWEVTINFEKELSPAYINDRWTKITRKLRERGIVALWVREPSRDNRCHHHLLLKNQITERELRRIVKESLPSRSELPTHTHIERIRNQWNYVWYITNAKIRSVVDGKEVKDKHRKKRLLFAPKLGLRKVGRIGKFWVKSREAIWQDIRDREKNIAEGLEQPLIRQLCDHVYEMCGGGVSRKRIEHSFGYSADTPAIRDWAETVEQGDNQWPVDNEQLAGDDTSENNPPREIPRSCAVGSGLWWQWFGARRRRVVRLSGDADLIRFRCTLPKYLHELHHIQRVRRLAGEVGREESRRSDAVSLGITKVDDTMLPAAVGRDNAFGIDLYG